MFVFWGVAGVKVTAMGNLMELIILVFVQDKSVTLSIRKMFNRYVVEYEQGRNVRKTIWG